MDKPSWIPAYVGLGSNLDDPPRQLDAAVVALRGLARTRLVAVSDYFRNPPMGVAEQPDFYNAVAGLITQLPAPEMLRALKDIERARGRELSTAGRWGPRVIDLDLLVYGRLRTGDAGMTIPHPGIAQRNFVLFPLLEIAPGLEIPGLGWVGDIAARLDRSGLQRQG